jgi:hypothetical protein
MDKQAKKVAGPKTAVSRGSPFKRHRQQFEDAGKRRRAMERAKRAALRVKIDGHTLAWVVKHLAKGFQQIAARKYRDLGNLLIALRCSQNLSQAVFAARIGRSTSEELAMLERTKYRGVSSRVIRDILWALAGKHSLRANLLRIKRSDIAAQLRRKRSYMNELRRLQLE